MFALEIEKNNLNIYIYNAVLNMYLFIYLHRAKKGILASEVKGARPCLGDIAVSLPTVRGCGREDPFYQLPLCHLRGQRLSCVATHLEPAAITDAFADTMVSSAVTHTYTTVVC